MRTLSDIRQRLSKRYPEIERFDSHQAASDAMNVLSKELLNKPTLWLTIVGYIGLVSVCGFGMLPVARRWMDVPPIMHGLIGGGMVGGVCFVPVKWFWRRRCQRFLHERLIVPGVPVCLKCGYDLRGQTEPRCPECGNQFESALIEQ